jgi:hypothetical protein
MNNKRTITNTTKVVKENPLAYVFPLGAKGGIERQEKQGQDELVHSDVLPTKISPEDKKILEKAGVVFLHTNQDDKLFQTVELPKIWRILPTSHSMWSNLVDNKDRIRASIFYKASFYDREAFLRCTTRYTVQYFDTHFSAVDGDIVLFKGREWKNNPAGGIVHDGSFSASREDCEKYLTTYYPNWRNPAAYWE